MLTPKNQLADMLTKASFTRDEWNHLLHLLNSMNYSTLSRSHFFQTESRVSCQKETKKALQMKVRRWRSQSRRILCPIEPCLLQDRTLRKT